MGGLFDWLLGSKPKPKVQKIDPLVETRLEGIKPMTEEERRIQASLRHAEQIRETAKPKTMGQIVGQGEKKG